MKYIKVKQRASSRISVPNFLSGVNTAYDQSVLSLSVAANCYNFDFTSGALKGSLGFISQNIKADSVWIYHNGSEQYLMYSYGGEVFYKGKSGITNKLEGIKLNGVPKAIGYRLYGEDVVLICSPSDNMVVWNGVDPAYYVSSSPLITSMAMHYERMFVSTSNEVNTLWFSDDLDPTNWNTDMTEGGFIELADERGALIKVLSFLNYVYIFRERGISRLTAYAEQSEFTVSNLFVTGGKIYPESIALCGDKVIFASSDGLFTFDGVSARRILTNLDGLIAPDENCVATYHGGKYYLALKANFESDSRFKSGTNNAILIYGDNGYTLMRGYDVSGFYSGGDTLYAIIDGKLHVQGGKCSLPKRWTVPQTDLGSGRVKRIKVLYIDTKTDITLTVHIDEKSKQFFVAGKGTASRININMPGRKFGMTVDCAAADPLISRPQLTFSFIDK
ncbi:MAG: hypothetical protein J1F36_03200 [Clostridiales bacterium]|nr:hypothetical protein [Clostridiales bacterium]